ncbi:MAG: zinc-ribbon domain-containing protein [Clostridia bacterium]|nr:zinc-ribbon domain-containing protein [Clostridia bacterium]
MFCKNCGAKMNPGAMFCRQCGTKAELPEPQAERPAPVPADTKTVTPNTYPTQKTKSKAPLIIVAVLISILLLAGTALATYFFLNKDADSAQEAHKQEEVMPTNSPAPVEQQKDLALPLQAFITRENAAGDMTIAVLDNKTGKTYFGGDKEQKFTAWGFYLPIYLVYDAKTASPDQSLLNGVMSSDPGVCNAAGNNIIRLMGGPSGISEAIVERFRTSATSYGRYFAQANASGDNFTNAEESVAFLGLLNQKNMPSLLSYDLSKFGITAPAGAKVYAQIGTENNAVRKQLNVFAIVKGEKSDYCISILTQNSKGTNLSDLLETIHKEMEGMNE